MALSNLTIISLKYLGKQSMLGSKNPRNHSNNIFGMIQMKNLSGIVIASKLLNMEEYSISMIQILNPSGLSTENNI
jgi:hypothetical protein